MITIRSSAIPHLPSIITHQRVANALTKFDRRLRVRVDQLFHTYNNNLVTVNKMKLVTYLQGSQTLDMACRNLELYPTLHSMQCDEESLPSSLLYVPAIQALQNLIEFAATVWE
jgi:hypothetical protein